VPAQPGADAVIGLLIVEQLTRRPIMAAISVDALDPPVTIASYLEVGRDHLVGIVEAVIVLAGGATFQDLNPLFGLSRSPFHRVCSVSSWSIEPSHRDITSATLAVRPRF
jgi:hypothetical protein